MYVNGQRTCMRKPRQSMPEPAHIDWPDLTEKGGVKGRSQANIAAFLDRIGAELAFNELAYCTVLRRTRPRNRS